ncbi:hypothetical protein BDW75DRAFT_132494 [Aspergillus navahoensis]
MHAVYSRVGTQERGAYQTPLANLSVFITGASSMWMIGSGHPQYDMRSPTRLSVLPPHGSTARVPKSGAGRKAPVLANDSVLFLSATEKAILRCDERMRMNLACAACLLPIRCASALLSFVLFFLLFFLQQASLVQAALIRSILCTGCTCFVCFLILTCILLLLIFYLTPYYQNSRRAVLSGLTVLLFLLRRIPELINLTVSSPPADVCLFLSSCENQLAPPLFDLIVSGLDPLLRCDCCSATQPNSQHPTSTKVDVSSALVVI